MDDTPVDPKGGRGRMTSHEMAQALLIPVSRDLAAYVNDGRYIEVARVLDMRLQDDGLAPSERAIIQAAIYAVIDATLDAVTSLR